MARPTFRRESLQMPKVVRSPVGVRLITRVVPNETDPIALEDGAKLLTEGNGQLYLEN